MKNILFVCSANLNRSPTFERWFRLNRPNYNVKSAGTQYGYPHHLAGEEGRDLLEWSVYVFVMEQEHAKYIKKFYPDYKGHLEVLYVPDEYDPDDPLLIKWIERWVELNNF